MIKITFGDMAESLADLCNKYGLFSNFTESQIYENAIKLKNMKGGLKNG